MKIIKTDNPNIITAAVDILSIGGIIVYPTDTLYGFGVDATNEAAIEKINYIKGRGGPISVMAPDTETAISWMHTNIIQNDLAPFYLGGQKTLIAPVKPNIVSSIILGANSTLGIRIPNNEFCNNLSSEFGKPITSTSVNRTNEKPLNDPEIILSEFREEVDLIVDGGTLPYSKGSTIYQLVNNNIKIIRE